MSVFNAQSFSQICKCSVGCIEKGVFTYIVLWSDPFSFQYSPERFSNVQMGRTRWKIEKEKSSFLLDRPQLTYFKIAVDGGVIKYNKRDLADGKGKTSRKLAILSAVILSVVVNP